VKPKKLDRELTSTSKVGSLQESDRHFAQLGSITLSMTWIMPFDW
jgi:hypothetical protein